MPIRMATNCHLISRFNELAGRNVLRQSVSAVTVGHRRVSPGIMAGSRANRTLPVVGHSGA